jgi:hypothetical protein
MNSLQNRLNITPLVSIIIPVIRPENMPFLVKTIQKQANVHEAVYEILTAEDKDRIGCPKMVKALTDKSRGSMVMFLGDDCIPWKGFLKYAIEAMDTLPDRWGLVGLNDMHHDGNKLATHWMAHKRLLKPLGGEFFHTGYTHCFSDQELNHRAKELGRYVWAEKAKIKHRNPIIDENYKLDDDYRRVYAQDVFEADRQLFIKRQASGWTYKKPADVKPRHERKLVAIGLPLYGPKPRFEKFEKCLHEMRQYSLAHGIGTVLIKNHGSIVHHSRNKIIDTVRRDYPKCEYLFMVDDDMTFPPDTLVKLLSHKKEFVCCNAYRKVTPYAPIAQIWNIETEGFNTIHVDPAKGKIRRISTVGTGVVLIDMDVFNKIPFPWFEFAYAPDDNKENKHLIEGMVLIGEDMNFCFKTANARIQLYCDFSIDVGHILSDENGNEKIINWKTHEEAWQKLDKQLGKESRSLSARR